jgi:hypothetical protein
MQGHNRFVHRDSHVAKRSILILAERALALLTAVSLNHVNARLEHAGLLSFDFTVVTNHRVLSLLSNAMRSTMILPKSDASNRVCFSK